MREQLPHIIHQAATCPQFRLQLLTNPMAVLNEQDLAQEDLAVLTEALKLLAQREGSTGQEPERKAGWDGGPSFTTAAIF